MFVQGVQTMDGEIVTGIIGGAGVGAALRGIGGAIGGAVGRLIGGGGAAAGTTSNVVRNVVFDSGRGHGARHLAGTGLSQQAVENAIRQSVQSIYQGASSVGQFSGIVQVQGSIIYRAFPLPNGTVNVGTYFPKP